MKATLTKTKMCSVMTVIGLVVSLYGQQIRTNEAGLEIIGNAEGCMRDPYKCPAGYWTIGIGSRMDKSEINRISGLTDREIADRWKDNIVDAEQCVNEYFHGKDMNDNQFSAMTSMVFNHGCKALRVNKNTTFTRIYTHAKLQQWNAMCRDILDWDMNGKYAGLTARKKKESALCLTPVHS